MLSRSFVGKYLQISTITMIACIICLSAIFMLEMNRRFKIDLMDVEASYIETRMTELKKAVSKIEYYLNHKNDHTFQSTNQIAITAVNAFVEKLSAGADTDTINSLRLRHLHPEKVTLFIYQGDELLFSNVSLHKECSDRSQNTLIYKNNMDALRDLLGDKDVVKSDFEGVSPCFGDTPQRVVTYVAHMKEQNLFIGAITPENWKGVQSHNKMILTFKRMNRSQFFSDASMIYLYRVLDLNNPEIFAETLVHPDEKRIGSILGAKEFDYVPDVAEGIRKDGEVFVTRWTETDQKERVPILSYFKLYPSFNYILSSHVTLSGVSQFIANQELRLINERNKLLALILMVGIILIIVVVILNTWIGRQMKKEVNIFNRFFKDLTFTLQRIDLSHVQSEEFAVLGKYANSMLDELFLKKTEIEDFNRTLEKRVSDKTRELNDLNISLEERIEKEVALSRIKDQTIHANARHAAMAELLVNISHQWRQPLNNIGLILQEYEDQCLNEGMMLAIDELKKLSGSLDDFHQMYRSDEGLSDVQVLAVANKVVEHIKEELEGDKKILFRVNIDEELTLKSNDVSLELALRHLVENAVDAIVATAIENGQVTIAAAKQNGRVCIDVIDNGGGILPKYFDDIFTPYFTTRYKSFGKGLGLYKAKILVENKLNGKINFKNTRTGVNFLIELMNV